MADKTIAPFLNSFSPRQYINVSPDGSSPYGIFNSIQWFNLTGTLSIEHTVLVTHGYVEFLRGSLVAFRIIVYHLGDSGWDSTGNLLLTQSVVTFDTSQ